MRVFNFFVRLGKLAAVFVVAYLIVGWIVAGLAAALGITAHSATITGMFFGSIAGLIGISRVIRGERQALHQGQSPQT